MARRHIHQDAIEEAATQSNKQMPENGLKIGTPYLTKSRHTRSADLAVGSSNCTTSGVCNSYDCRDVTKVSNCKHFGSWFLKRRQTECNGVPTGIDQMTLEDKKHFSCFRMHEGLHVWKLGCEESWGT
jgi:hypothetical protein